ncbi:tRNA (cytidine(34)-2'-O)-methyltransferase [Achromobacter deleyi]|uniref:tRNA (cytidine(34)-2'-O)-methyltransferase n=1 Tax=Achromobacter deleyi TaxID=1353891 RepID=A0A7T4B6Y1_9BURK|nr:tRNA (cytidine(34)-2'-O)-methyltransferase [Achromobacter deleyi]QQB36779.1 tRNA (cytidine(34)-2'-O)-methyltransferase [Achromobacter deleyi]
MFHVILVCPEIPPNTGNAIRLCANTGAQLHLVRPLGFELDDARMRRAGLDYHEWQPVRVHDTLQEALADTGAAASHIYALTTHAQRSVGDVRFEAGDVFVFGRESAGLSEEHHAMFAPQQRLRLPMRAGQRSLNLSNAVAVTVFEAWRQLGYEGGG